MRKALETIAFASIAPNKVKYQSYRSRADNNPDFKKDYKASSIIKTLSKINPDFYPVPLLPAKQLQNGTWHFERKTENIFDKKLFIALYDKLGRYLHADNPWSGDKAWENFALGLTEGIYLIRNMLELYFTVIRTPEFSGVWVLEKNNNVVRLLVANALGDFIVEN